MNFIVILCLLLIGCSPRSSSESQSHVSLEHLKALNSLWTEYFLAEKPEEMDKYLARIEQQVDELASATTDTNRMVLHQRFLLNGTRAVEALKKDDHATAEMYGLRAFDAWLLFDPASPTLVSAQTNDDKLKLVVQRVSEMNEFAASLARGEKEGSP